jgi:hypothetical protein
MKYEKGKRKKEKGRKGKKRAVNTAALFGVR